MNVLSLFDGISVGRQALKELGIECTYYSSEIEDSSILVSKDNHPDIIRLGDVTKWKEWNLPEIDLIIGGSPCQGFSRQGIGLNFEDPRSKLFFEFSDIVKHYNPKYFMLENVDMAKEWQDVISEYMGVEPVKINSDLFLPHNRPRTYWTNINLKELPKNRCYENLKSILEDIELEEYEEKDGIRICNSFSENSKALVSFENGELRVKQAVLKGYAVAEHYDGINISFATSKSRRGRVVKKRSNCLDTSCNIGVYDNRNQIRRFTVKELERLQGLPDNYTRASESRSKSIKMLGNGWTLDVIKHIFGGLK